MSTYASKLMDNVARDLLDEATDDDDRRWPRTDLLKYLNAGERQLVYFLPTAYTVTKIFRLSYGTRQTLPDGTDSYVAPGTTSPHPQAIELVSINRNMGTDGQTVGNAILPVEKDVMNRLKPDWHTATASTTVQHSMFNPKDRNKFDVYPPQPAAGGTTYGWIEVVYSAVPPEIEAESGPSYDVNINLEDIYVEPLEQFMKFEAYSKDAATSEFAAARALAGWNQFVTLIGRKDLVERKYNSIKRHTNVNRN